MAVYMSERDAIVAWLRQDAGKTMDDLKRLHVARKLTPAQTAEWEALIALKGGVANAIERGDHLPDAPEPVVDAVVTDADREAAADLEAWERDDSKRARFLSGEFDGTRAVQLFARHRIVHSPVDEVARLREALEQIARLGVDMKSDFSRSADQSRIARKALGTRP